MQKFSKIFIRVLVVVAIGISLFALASYFTEKKTSPELSQAPLSAKVVSITIDTGSTSAAFEDVPYEEGMTVFEALRSLASSSSVQIVSEDYGGELGVFIESINGVGLGEKDKWWQFWVNDQYATVGASMYVLRPSDKVLFWFTSDKQKEDGSDY